MMKTTALRSYQISRSGKLTLQWAWTSEALHVIQCLKFEFRTNCIQAPSRPRASTK
jgi:hypothetical protein